MNCQRCGTTNDDSALFCRECGAGLSSKNVMDAFPELKFMPSTIAKPKQKRTTTFMYYLFLLISLGLGVTTIVFYANELSNGLYRYDGAFEVFCMIVVALFVSSMITIGYYSKRNVKLPKEVEYVSLKPKMRRFPFIVINNKIGVFDMKKRKITIPCEYDSLTWFMVGKILIAKHSEKGQIRIDICNNELK